MPIELDVQPTILRNSFVHDLENHTKEQKKPRHHVLKLLLVICPALLAAGILASIGMVNARSNIKTAEQLKQNVQFAVSVRKLLTKLRKERGLTCIMLSENVTFENGGTKVFESRKETDLAMDSMKNENVSKRLSSIRQWVDKTSKDSMRCAETISRYTALTNELMFNLSSKMHDTREGKFYSLVQSFEGIIYANDLIGISRAMGGSFFANGDSTRKEWTKFSRISGSGHWLIGQALHSIPKLNDVYDNFENSPTDKELKRLLNILETNNMTDEAPEKAYEWFNCMTKYIEVVGQMETVISFQLHVELSNRVDYNMRQFWTQMVIFVSICIILPTLAFIYVFHTDRLIRKCNNFSLQVLSKGQEIEQQKQRTDLIVNRILPIAQKLSVKCRCDKTMKNGVDDLRAEIMCEIWKLNQKDTIC